MSDRERLIAMLMKYTFGDGEALTREEAGKLLDHCETALEARRIPWDHERSERDTAREMTQVEVHEWYDHKRWPCCGQSSTVYVRGPEGGASVNVACVRCDMRLNVINPLLGYPATWGQVIREARRLQ